MSEFDNCTDWILVNDFTIHEKRELSDRPFMVTRVPNSLEIELRDFKLVFGVRWTGDVDEVNKKPHHESGWSIDARGIMGDRIITVFHLEKGVIAQFDRLDHVLIKGIQNGKVGGKRNATSFVGIDYSGISSRKVPEKGLMEGEPGSIYYIDNRGLDDDPIVEQTEILCANVYIEQDTFDELVECLTKGYNDIEKIEAVILAEFFQGEVEAALAEPWMLQEYGIRLVNDKPIMQSTNARLESINLTWKTKNVEPAPI